MTEEELRCLIEKPEGNVEFKSKLINRSEIAEYCVGIGNAGGGWLIMGVSDRRPRDILSFQRPSDEELRKIQDSVADGAEIHIVPEILDTTEGCVVAISIPGRPRGALLHTRDGKYLIRLGDGLRGMTPKEIDAIRAEAGVELTAKVLPGKPESLLSPSGMEDFRQLMAEVESSSDLMRLGDADLLRSLGVITKGGHLRMAGLILAGKREAIEEHLSASRWQFRRMTSDTNYDQSEDGCDCLATALRRLRELVSANNPVTTIPGMLVHAEFPRYPHLALRELIVNALVHRDYEIPGAVALKLYPDRLELSNPGGFVAGVNPNNILHHPSSPRYQTLMQALGKMRLANAANLGVPRIYRDLLTEGKEPPSYWCSDRAVRVTVKGQDARKDFVGLMKRHGDLEVDHLLVLQYLTRHREIRTETVSEICQRPPDSAREVLGRLATQWKLLEIGGSGKGRYYRLSRDAYNLLVEALDYHVDKRLSLENAKARVLDTLKLRPLTNAEIREITQLSRYQVVGLMKNLQRTGQVRLEGRGRSSRWQLSRRLF